jgi:hypothetical protein
MHDDYIGRQIGRATRTLFLFAALPMAAVVLTGIQSHRFLANLVQGPIPMSWAELQAVSDPQTLRRYNVSVDGDEMIPTNFQKVRQTRASDTNKVTKVEVEQRFSILTVGDRHMLVSSTAPLLSAHLRGGLVPIPIEVREHVLSPLERKNPKIAGSFLPTMLDTAEFSSDAWILPACGLLLVILAGWGIIKCAQWSSNPAGHPVARELQKRGDFNILRGRIDAEVRAENAHDQGTIVTTTWLLHPWPFGLKVRALGEIAWAYKLIVKRRVNFIPAGKTYHARIGDRQGKRIEIQGKEATVDALLVKLGQRAPWIVAGFNQTIEAMYRKQRPQFLAEVDRRKAALKTEPATAITPEPQPKRSTPVGVA